MQSFRRRAILPADAAFFSIDGLLWPEEPGDLEVSGVATGGPLGFGKDEREQTVNALIKFIDLHKERLGVASGVKYRIPSFHPVYRTDRTGSVRWDLVVEIVQKSDGTDGLPVRGGTTLIVSTHGTRGSGDPGVKFLRYAIRKPLYGEEGERRGKREREFLQDQGLDPKGDPDKLRVNFAFEHGGS
jgi:hypothetical protein